MSERLRVKICGLKELEHALVATECGADFLGFVFAPSKRRLTPAVAREIIRQLPAGPARVGLFVNESPALVNEIAAEVGLDYVQLCGEEPPDYLDEIERPAIKSITVLDTSDIERAAGYYEKGATALFDAQVPGQGGGGGRSLDWSLLKAHRPAFPFLLAGGLNPANVQEAIMAVRPWGVDVSSGVEVDGRKSSELIAAFIQAARRVG